MHLVVFDRYAQKCGLYMPMLAQCGNIVYTHVCVHIFNVSLSNIWHIWNICPLFTWYWGELQPNICKIAQSSLYSWTMYIIIKNEVLPPYTKLPCHKVAPGIPLPLSQFSHFAKLQFWPQLYISANFAFTFVGLCWFVSIDIHLGVFEVFYPPFLYLGEEHVSWSTCSHKWHVFTILFFMSCPEPPMGISGVGSFPVWSRGTLIISSSLGVGY